MTAYLDASVILPMLVKEAGSDRIDQFLVETSGTIVVSTHLL